MVVLYIDSVKSLSDGASRLIGSQDTLARLANGLSSLNELLLELARSVLLFSA